jgi:DNA-binding CsgD family transcriptional regulator
VRALVLGRVRLLGDTEVALPRGRVGKLLSAFLVRPNETQSVERLCELLWPDDGDADEDRLHARLQLVVTRLRRFLGGGDESHGLAVVTDEGGYRLLADEDALDSVAFEALAARVLAGATELVAPALALWEGKPYGALAATPDLRRSAVRLARLRSQLEQIRDGSAPSPSIGERFARTKFFGPRVDSGHTIARPRLLDLAGRVGDSAVLAVMAPGGFGKSVFLAQWAEAQSVPVAWVNLEPADTDPVRFWSAVLASFAEAGALDPLERPAATPGSQVFVAELETALARNGTGIGLVLDDVHALDDPGVLRRLRGHLSCLPEWITVALGSRLPLVPEVRARGEVRTVTAADLTFTLDEIGAVLPWRDRDIGDAELAAVARATEAWPVAVSYLSRSGVRLTQLELVRDLEDYVVDEVLLAIPDARRRFLLETAHLEWLHASLCDAVRDAHDSDEQLAWLLRHELFVTDAEAETGWLRYHHLIGGVLRRRADADPAIDVAAVRRRAARWCRQHDLGEAALRYGIAGGDDDVVADLAGPVVLSLALRGEMHACDRLIAQLDPDVVARNRSSHDAVMLLVAGWSEPERAERWVASRGRDEADADVMAMSVRSHQAMMQGRLRDALDIFDETRAAADAYFEAHPPPPGLREVALGTLEMASVCVPILRGDVRSGDETAEAAAEAARSHPAMAAWVLGDLAFLAYVEGDRDASRRFMEELDPILATMDRRSIELGSTRALVTRALLASDGTDDPSVQRRLRDDLLPLVHRYESLDWRIELIAVLLALHVTSYRAREFKDAAAYAAHANMLLARCDDVQLLRSARERLDMAGGPAGGALVGSVDPSSLSERQRQVLARLESGMTYKEIAESLGTTLAAVQSVIRAVYAKLGVHSRYEARRVLQGRPPDPRT